MRPALVLSTLLVSCAVSFAAAATWDPRFGGSNLGDPGFNDTVHAIARDGSSVYAAGGFWGVWSWNGSSWTRVGSTLAQTINDLAVTSNHDIYAGGFFSSINASTGSIPANHIARWDGSDWGVLNVGGTVLTTGLNQGVYALATAPNGTDVYVGGNFTQAGGLTRNYVARWDGSTFQTVGNNLFNNAVNEILVSGNDVYFGGEFTLPFTRVAHYNGSLFEFMNGGPNGRVYGLALYNGELYAAGSFTTVGTGPAAGVARWDGTNWYAVASSLSGGSLLSLLSSGGYLYLMGGFSAINSVAVNNVARWNGFTWSPLSTGASGAVYAAASVGGDVWIAGGFASVGAWPAHGVAIWNGTNWGFGGAADVIRDIANDPAGSIVVAGDFLQVGNLPVNRIARWNGTAWSKLGSGVDGSARCVVAGGNDIYVGGNFSNAGGNPAAGIARWNGSAWSGLGYGVNGIPYDLALDGGDLYVAGTMTPLNTPYANLARWDGSAWGGVGNGPPNAAARCVVVHDGRVFVGGDFTAVGGTPANRIAVFDGSAWSALGAGFDASVYGIAVRGDDVYAVGDFTVAGGSPGNRIARWNGTTWSPLGLGFNGGARTVLLAGTELLAGGNFTTANGVSTPHLARWNGIQWASIGGGTDDRVLAMAVTTQGLYTGGFFRQAGSVPSDRIANWVELFPTPVVSGPAATRLGQNIPNPFNPTTTIRYTLDRPGPVTLRVYDVRGALVRTLVEGRQGAGPHLADWDGRDDRGVALASGTYFCRLEAVGGGQTRKMVLLK